MTWGEVINIVKPDVIVLGYDQSGMEKRVQEYVNTRGLNIKVVRVGKFEAEEIDSSSKIQKKIVDKWIARQRTVKKPVEKNA